MIEDEDLLVYLVLDDELWKADGPGREDERQDDLQRVDTTPTKFQAIGVIVVAVVAALVWLVCR